ncbi:MAG: Ig-like domain-containing protein [Noviherbaspirillum sp.]
MNPAQRFSGIGMWFISLLLIALTAGCGGGGGKDAILGIDGSPGTTGSPDTTRPTVTLTQPANGASGVARSAAVSAVLSEEMDATSINAASFTLTAPGGAAIAGTVSYATGSKTATFTPTTPALLPPGSMLTATISTAAKDLAGNTLESNFVWTFTTVATEDTTRPTVTLTVPADGAQDVVRNTRIAATFSEDMDPASINGTTFTLTGPGASVVTGAVTYSASSRSALFSPSAPALLAAGATYTAAISSAARDLAGNSLAAGFVWTFTTGATADAVPPTVISTNPADGATNVCSNKVVSVSFSEAMDPSTIDAASFTVQRSGPPLDAPLAGAISYDAANRVASFTSALPLAAGSHTVTVSTAVKDLAGNPLAASKVTTFITSASLCPVAPPLGAAASFGAFGGNATVTNDGLLTLIRGNIGVNAASTKITGLRDQGANVYTVTTSNDGRVDGLVYTLTAPPGSVAGAAVTQARIDAMVAFNAISPALLPGGIDVSSLAACPSCGGAGGGADELAGRTLPPGVYRSTTGTYDIGGASRTSASLTLDAGGDANAVWIFQTAAGTGTLNVGLTGPATPAVPIKVLLLNGAQAKNVFWYVPGGAVIGTGSTMTGTMLSDAAISISTTGGSPPTAVPTTLNGRALSLTAGVTMTNTLINTPAP